MSQGYQPRLDLDVELEYGGCRLREVAARSILAPSRLADYCVNPYAGCEHGCVYCYARSATRFSHPQEEWGSFVDVRGNALSLIAREAARKRPGRVFISSLCDGWQPVEARYALTRRCIEVLLRHGFSLRIHTKSTLVARDFDLLGGHPSIELGMTITTLEPKVAALFEPGASPPPERVDVLRRAQHLGIPVFVFLAPLLPLISDRGEGLAALFDMVRELGPDYVLADRLNPRYGMWPTVRSALEKHDPALVPEYHRLLYDHRTGEQYTADLRRRVTLEAGRHGLLDRLRLVC